MQDDEMAATVLLGLTFPINKRLRISHPLPWDEFSTLNSSEIPYSNLIDGRKALLPFWCRFVKARADGIHVEVDIPFDLDFTNWQDESLDFARVLVKATDLIVCED